MFLFEQDDDESEREWQDRLHWVDRAPAKKPLVQQDTIWRVEHVAEHHVRGKGLLHIGPYQHRAYWGMPTFNGSVGCDKVNGRHLPLHLDPDFERAPFSDEFFGFGSLESLMAWFTPEFTPWLRLNLFVCRRFIGDVTAGQSQATLNTQKPFRLDATVFYYADR